MRSVVTIRADSHCEYCGLPSEGQVGRFPIDHILPRTAGGTTISENLALACPHCNAHKWAHTEGLDSDTDTVVPLLHPRRQVWPDHFTWSVNEPFHLLGLTPTGQATIDRLQMNHPELITTRRLLALLGRFPRDNI